MIDPTARDLLQQLRDGINRHVAAVEDGKQFEELLAAIDSYLAATPKPAVRPTDKDLYDLAEVFNGDPVPAMRRALELYGH